MHKKAFGDRAQHGPTGGSHSASPDPLSGFKGAASRQEMGAGRDKRERRGEVRKDYLPCHQFLDPPLCASVLSAG